jgi:succinyl-CoA synthetase beta subunit
VQAVLVNIFGGILRCDILAEGLIKAARQVEIKVPLIIRLEGTNVDRGRELLQQSGLDFLVAPTMGEAARKVGELVKS